MKKIRIALIGAGKGHSWTFHGPALKNYCRTHPGRVELAAVCDLQKNNAEEYAKDFGFLAAYSDMNRMIEIEKPDGILAITPISTIESIAGNILKRGIPVLMEKTPGENSASTLRLLRIAKKHKTAHMISFNRRFNPAILKAREWLHAHFAQRPLQHISGRMLRSHRADENFAIGTGIHLLDAILSFFPKAPRSVTTQKCPYPKTDSFSFHSFLEFPGKMSASVTVAPLCDLTEETYEIFGPQYVIRLDVIEPAIQIIDKGKTVLDWRMDGKKEFCEKDGTPEETEYFLDHLRADQPMRPNLLDGFASMRVAEAVQKGGRTEIRLP